MSLPEDRQYSLEDIIAEFKSDPGSVPGKKRETKPSLAAELAFLDESFWPELAEESAPAQDPPRVEPSDTPAAAQPREKENISAQDPAELTAGENADLHTLNMEVKTAEPVKSAEQLKESAPSDEPSDEAAETEIYFPTLFDEIKAAGKKRPLTFPGLEAKEPPRPRPVSDDTKRRNLGSAPWRTKPEKPVAASFGETAEKPKKPEPPAAEKKPRLRTVDFSGTERHEPLNLMPDQDAFDPEEPVKRRKERPFIPYDLINRSVDDAGQAASRLSRRIGSMAVRLMASVPVCAVAVWLTGAAGRDFPMPAGFTFAGYSLYYHIALGALLLISMALSWEVTVSGLWRLIRLRPTLDTVVSVSGLVSLAYCAAVILFPKLDCGLPAVCVCTATDFFALIAKRQRMEALRRNYKSVAMSASPIGVKLYSDGKVQDMAVKTQSGVDIDLPALAQHDDTERFSCYYAPIVLIFALALAVSASVAKDVPQRFFWSISYILAAAAPMCLLLSSSAVTKNLGKKLYTSGSSLINAVLTERLAKARFAVLRDADLYPVGAVKITGMKIAEDQEPEVVVGCAASLLQEVGGGLSKAFLEFARQQYIVPNKARELRFFETRGISAAVSGRYVQLGTASYLMRSGIDVTEGLKLKNSIFIAIDSRFAGIFSMRYEAQTPVYSAFGLLRHGRIRPVLALRDTAQTQNIVENRFELKRDTAFLPDLEERLNYSAASFGREEETLALLSRDGLMPMAEVLLAAKKLRRASRWGIVMGLICALSGMAILAFLTGGGAAAAADPLNILFYLLLWSFPVKMIRGIITRL
ncbi:MAG: hypothetical protein IJT76_03655 [Clostridia bacterium]|nr:hypothetical protein [Clostridia bacterium]